MAKQTASETGKEIIASITGSFPINLQCFKVTPPNDENVYQPFIVVDITLPLGKKIQAYDDAVVYSEVGVLATLKHKYICPINDFFIQDDCYFMVMEHMDGGDLFDRLGHKST